MQLSDACPKAFLHEGVARLCTTGEGPYTEPVDYIAPTDQGLQSMTDEGILGPLNGATADDLAGRYAIELGVSEAELEGLGIGPEDMVIMDRLAPENHCYIGLKRRRMVNGRRCCRIK